MTGRIGKIERDTAETRIQMTLDLDGAGKADIRTGIGFLITCSTVLPATGSLT